MSESQPVNETNISKQTIWITWEDHRRSRELSRALDAKYALLFYKGSPLVRYVVLSIKTLRLLSQEKPTVVFCQNPSQVLAALLCILKSIFSYVLVVDRHTNFKLHTVNSKNPKWVIFHALSRYSIRRADRTIVTNTPLADVVSGLGGRAIVLPDKLPELKYLNKTSLKGRINFMFICTFSADEPVQEVCEVFSRLPNDYCLYITGNFKKYKDWESLRGISNIVLLGYLPEKAYQEYLYSCDVTIVLTGQQMTLNCGSYESIVAGKPQIVAESEVIRDYFNLGAIYTELTISSIRNAVLESVRNSDDLRKQVALLRSAIEVRWTKIFEKFKSDLREIRIS